MGFTKKLYSRAEWHSFRELVLTRDGYLCRKCGRGRGEVTLQVHHTRYVARRQPWDYDLSDCITLCAGCHAREHGHIQPMRGWTLLGVTDLGDLLGLCENARLKGGKRCNQPIRWECHAYHPNFGYLNTGSKCIEHLTLEDQVIAKRVVSAVKLEEARARQVPEKVARLAEDERWVVGAGGRHIVLRKHPRFTATIAESFYVLRDQAGRGGLIRRQASKMGVSAHALALSLAEGPEKSALRDIYKRELSRTP